MTSQPTPSPTGAGAATATTSAASSQPPANSSSPAATPPSTEEKDWSQATEKDKADAISDLLRGGTPEPQPGSGDVPSDGEGGSDDPWMPPEGETQESTEPPSTLADLAEKLGMQPEQVYDLELTTGDGETVKLGALKDAYQNRQAEARESAKRAKALDERESALTADAQLWSAVAAEVGRHLTPQTKQRLRDREIQNDREERRRLAAAMPELNDPDVLDRFKRSFVETLQGYGFGPHEMHITDHRNVVLVRDLMRYKTRLDKLLSYEPQQEPPKAARTKGRDTGANGRQQQMINRAAHGTEKQKVDAISALLKG